MYKKELSNFQLHFSDEVTMDNCWWRRWCSGCIIQLMTYYIQNNVVTTRLLFCNIYLCKINFESTNHEVFQEGRMPQLSFLTQYGSMNTFFYNLQMSLQPDLNNLFTSYGLSLYNSRYNTSICIYLDVHVQIHNKYPTP